MNTIRTRSVPLEQTVTQNFWTASILAPKNVLHCLRPSRRRLIGGLLGQFFLQVLPLRLLLKEHNQFFDTVSQQRSVATIAPERGLISCPVFFWLFVFFEFDVFF